MNRPKELTAENLDTQIDSLLAGKTLMVDPALVTWCSEDYTERLAKGDGRSVSKAGNTYDNLYLFWGFISSRANPEDEYWAAVPQVALKDVRNNGKWFLDTKTLFDAQGWADLSPREDDPDRMRTIPSGEPVLVKLHAKSTDLILGNFTDDDPACFDARLALNETEIVESEAKSIIRKLYLDHIERREIIRASGVPFIPCTRKEENRWWDHQDAEWYQEDKSYDGIETYNQWMMDKAFRVNASIINPVRQLRAGKGDVFRVEKFKGHRLFTPFAFLKRELRQAVRLQGEKLVCLDIRSCQPTLLANKTKELGLLNDCLDNEFYDKVSDHLEKHLAHPCSPYPIVSVEEGMPEDVLQWIENEWPKLRTPPRERAKFALMEYLFGPNQYKASHEGTDRFEIQKFMFANYPKTAKYVFALKRDMNYAQVARNLQADESKLFIDQYYCTDLRRAGILGLTVHDAVYVRESDADEAEELFEKRIEKEDIRAELVRE